MIRKLFALCLVLTFLLPLRAHAFKFGVESFICRTQDWNPFHVYCIPDKNKDETYNILLDLVKGLNVHFIRDGSQFDNMTSGANGKNKAFKFDTMSRLLKDLKQHGISIIWMIKATPSWALASKYKSHSSDPYNYPPSQNALTEIINFLIRNSSGYKNIIMFEIYNEPNIKHTDGWFGTVGEYINTLKTASSLLLKNNFRVMNGGMVTNIHSITDTSSEVKFYNAFKGANLSYIAIHSHGTIDALNNDYKNNVKKYNIPASRIILNESGYDSSANPNDEAAQALHTAGKAIWAFANYLGGYSAFYLGAINHNAYKSKDMYGYAMVRADPKSKNKYTLRLAYYAYKTVIDFLREAKFVRSYYQENGRYEYLFTNNGLKIYTAIGRKAVAKEVIKALGTSNYRVYDMTGKENGLRKEIQYFVSGNKPQIITTSLKAGIINSAYNLTLKASGAGPARFFTWKASGLPKGLKLTGSKITGKPSKTGKFNVTLTVSTKLGKHAKKLQLVIKDVKPSLKSSKLSSSAATIKRKYNAVIKNASGSNLKWRMSWKDGKRINGLNINSNNGRISGTPSRNNKPGKYILNVKASNSAGSYSRNFTITLKDEAPSITAQSLNNAAIGKYYSQTITASGSNLTLRWSWLGGKINGLNVKTYANEVLIHGRPLTSNKTGSFRIKITVKNSVKTVSKIFTIKLELDKNNAKRSQAVNKAIAAISLLMNCDSQSGAYNTSRTQIMNRNNDMTAGAIIIINGKEYVIASVLDAVSVSEAGQYDLHAVIHENIKTGAKLIWQANPVNADYSEDDDIADFYDSEDDSPIENVPESRLITVSPWLRADVIYEPVILVEVESEQ